MTELLVSKETEFAALPSAERAAGLAAAVALVVRLNAAGAPFFVSAQLAEQLDPLRASLPVSIMGQD